MGLNVTRPHKTTVIRFLDTIEKTARKIGAVNTIARSSRGLRGYNTDGRAALEVLQKLGGSLSGTKAAMLGAGGASRAITYYLSKTVESISVLNRTRAKGIKSGKRDHTLEREQVPILPAKQSKPAEGNKRE